MVTAVCGGLLATAASAAAEPVGATAFGSVGFVDVTVDGQHVSVPSIALCSVEGPPSGTTTTRTAGNVATFGNSVTACSRQADGTAVGQVNGRRFRTKVLKEFGGPEIAVRNFSAQCGTTATGSVGSVEVGEVTGLTVPENIPANYTITIPGGTADAPPMAKVILNELIAPTPPDGSLTTNTVHIKLFPDGGPAKGDIVVGSASCYPFGKPPPTPAPT